MGFPSRTRWYPSLKAWFGGIGQAGKALACVGVGPGWEFVQVEDGETPAVDGQCDSQHPDDVEQKSGPGLE